MKILVSGSNGLVGSALVTALRAEHRDVVRLVRTSGPVNHGAVAWNPLAARLDPGVLRGAEAVIHLAGENIASGRWTDSRKLAIRESRVAGTRLLSEALATGGSPVKTLVCASAVGYYGSRGDEVLNEDSGRGQGFLADVCADWEAATAAAAKHGVRVVNLRFGMILSERGGALPKMLTPFRLGAGGIVGDGRQFWSWITMADVVRAIQFALATPTLVGPVNVVAPQSVTNREFTKTLGAVLHRPTVFPLPAFAARLLLGEMADELLLASARVKPQRLQAAGFTFTHPELKEALHAVLR